MPPDLVGLDAPARRPRPGRPGRPLSVDRKGGAASRSAPRIVADDWWRWPLARTSSATGSTPPWRSSCRSAGRSRTADAAEVTAAKIDGRDDRSHSIAADPAVAERPERIAERASGAAWRSAAVDLTLAPEDRGPPAAGHDVDAATGARTAHRAARPARRLPRQGRAPRPARDRRAGGGVRADPDRAIHRLIRRRDGWRSPPPVPGGAGDRPTRSQVTRSAASGRGAPARSRTATCNECGMAPPPALSTDTQVLGAESVPPARVALERRTIPKLRHRTYATEPLRIGAGADTSGAGPGSRVGRHGRPAHP